MDEIEAYQCAWKTCLELIYDRNYQYDELYNTLNLDEFKYLITSNNLNVIGKNIENNKIIYIKFITLNKIRSSSIKEIINEIIKEISDNSEYDIILVLKNKPSTIIQKIEKDKDYSNIQIMYLKQLMYNPTKHKLVPKHTKISQQELSKIMDFYSIASKNQLPIILKDDPIVRYYNFKTGDVLKINASLGSLNTNYHSYRCVR